MDRMFPFGFESHLSFYLVVYVLTLVVHVFLMAYVLAGSLWLAWATLFPGTDLIPRTKQPLARILRDWMPFALSGAITAGVAPLLFVQILYRQQFYTANLLLGWRWMVVIPVLVIAFYLLYVVKSKVVSRMVAAGPTGAVDQHCGLFSVRCILLDCQSSAESRCISVAGCLWLWRGREIKSRIDSETAHVDRRDVSGDEHSRQLATARPAKSHSTVGFCHQRVRLAALLQCRSSAFGNCVRRRADIGFSECRWILDNTASFGANDVSWKHGNAMDAHRRRRSVVSDYGLAVATPPTVHLQSLAFGDHTGCHGHTHRHGFFARDHPAIAGQSGSGHVCNKSCFRCRWLRIVRCLYLAERWTHRMVCSACRLTQPMRSRSI